MDDEPGRHARAPRLPRPSRRPGRRDLRRRRTASVLQAVAQLDRAGYATGDAGGGAAHLRAPHPGPARRSSSCTLSGRAEPGPGPAGRGGGRVQRTDGRRAQRGVPLPVGRHRRLPPPPDDPAPGPPCAGVRCRPGAGAATRPDRTAVARSGHEGVEERRRRRCGSGRRRRAWPAPPTTRRPPPGRSCTWRGRSSRAPRCSTSHPPTV